MSTRFKVIVADFVYDAMEPERKILGDMADIFPLNAFKEEELLGRIEDADAIMIYHHLGLSRMTIERLEHCKLIVRCGGAFRFRTCRTTAPKM
jgi:D-3-phosphoglycerate dehydrogenase/C-terminal binding protein